MKEAIGGTWIFQIVIVFILLFTGFICLSINRSKAFFVKDRIIQIIQSYNGFNFDETYSDENDSALTEIVSYIKDSSYRNTGVIPADEEVGDERIPYQCYTKDGRVTTKNPVFCIAPIEVSEEGYVDGEQIFNELPKMIYYRVVVFYQLDLPIFHDVFNFKVVGDTKTLYGGTL